MDESRSEFAILHLDASEEKNTFSVELINFEIQEALSTGFKAVLYFLSASPSLPFDDIVGRGAALSLHTGGVGDRIWAGVCTELELVHSEEHTGSPGGVIAGAAAAAGIGGPNYKGRSQYRLTIEPDLYRLSLRTNSRIFQGLNAVDIVKTVLKDWDIEVDEKLSKLTEPHPRFDYKVQYQETDFDFVSRILEDAGISYWIQPHTVVPSTEKKKGNEITKLILRDAPANEPPTYDGKKNILPYLGDGPDQQHNMGPNIWSLSAKQQPKPLRKTIRDRDFRYEPDVDLDGGKVTEKDGRPATEGKYESFEYQPGAYWFADGKANPATPVADLKNVARTSDDQRAKLPLRRYQAELASRTLITFRTNALDIEPSVVLQIGTKDFGYDNNHPHPAFSTDKKLLVIGRKITGEQTGSHYTSELTAVYADQPFRPRLTTPKPRIYGIQSATVVGPTGSEIYTDEFGRVRVQFPWDRYAHYDEKSSCWIRVSQAWAGGGFGIIAHPRVGHEVLVGFFEGDPDQPIIVGRVHNASTLVPYSPATGDNATKSGIKTNTAGGAGFNEMSFQDKIGSELIHVQGQKDITFVINNNQSHDVGSALSYKVGSSESHDIGQSLTVKIGKTESHEMGDSFDMKVGFAGSSTEFKMDKKSIVFSTNKASITLSDDNIYIEATNGIHIHCAQLLHISTEGDIDMDAKGKMTVDTGGNLLLNCESAVPDPAHAAPAALATPPSGPSHGSPGVKPKLPHYQGVAPVVPGGLEHVNVGQDVEKKPDATKAPTAPTDLGSLASKVTDAAKNPVAAVTGAAKDGGLLGGIQSTLKSVTDNVAEVKKAIDSILNPVQTIVAEVKSIEAKVKEAKDFVHDPLGALEKALLTPPAATPAAAATPATPGVTGTTPPADTGFLGGLEGALGEVSKDLGSVMSPITAAKGLAGQVGQIETFVKNPLAGLKAPVTPPKK